MLDLLDADVRVPDYTTLCKRSTGLDVSLLTSNPSKPKHIVVDSTGLKVYGEGEWKVRQHGYRKRRTWRKLHLSVDESTQELQAVELTEAGVDDAEAGRQLLTDTPGDIDQVDGDGAYDKRKFYDTCTERVALGKSLCHPDAMPKYGSMATARKTLYHVTKTCAAFGK